ncbi:MAG: ExeM/NucH family extracellular endonuclease [Opitutae bacterium]|nr:ExeM/NucH family extracellular endonuclease [Opitutae bacterium]
MISLLFVLRRSISTAAVFAALATVALATPSVVTWNFATASPSSGLPASLSGGTVTQGNNNGTTTLLTTTSASSGYTGASGTNNAGAAARIGALNQAASGSAYFEFTLTPTAGGQIQASAIAFGSRSTSTGPQAVSVFSSVDNYTTAIATGALANNSTWALQSPTFTTVTGVANTAVTFRIYGHSGTGSPGANTANWRIDDMQLTVDVLGGGATPPAVASVTPADAATGRGLSTAISVTFNQAVNVTGDWFTVTGSASGAHTATVSGGPTTFTLTPSADFVNAETVTFTVAAAQVTDQSSGTLNMAADFTSSFTTIAAASGTPTAIHTIQGSGTTSAFATQSQTVQGVVVATFQASGGIGGYYLEAPQGEWDADDATSEGIYVFDNINTVAVGDLVAATGTVTEFASSGVTETEIASVVGFSKLSAGNSLPPAVDVTLPFASSAFAERYEGMRVTLPQTLVVTNNFDYGHFGELTLSTARQSTPTNVVAPGAAAIALDAQNQLDQIILDDGVSTSYPDPTPWLSSSTPSVATRRTGSTTTGVAGVLANKFGGYVVEPTATPTFVDANPRAASPATAGSLRIAIGNVENLMNGNGAGAGFPTSRGATTFAEYQRQLATVTAGILGLAPDIMGLTEVENDRVTNSEANSYGSTSMIAQLVASLNAAAPAGTTYAFVDASAVDIVTDVIHCAIVYRVETVELVGTPAMLSNDYFNNHARNPLAQTFRQKTTGEKLTVCINHFRAKAGASSMDDGTGLNADQSDGQGTNNYIRTKEAQALTAWLATDPTASGDTDFLIVGDLNAYAKEDPIAALVSAGYVNLTERFEGAGGYSYQFGGGFGHLDHALASPSLNTQTLAAATWHVNSDEPVYYDYNVENKSTAQQAINVGTGYRYADHDSVVVGVTLATARAITTQPVAQTLNAGAALALTVAATGTGTLGYQWFKDDVAIDGATSATYSVASATPADSGNYAVVVTDYYGSTTSDTVAVSVRTALQSWRQTHFGTTANSGNAADTADPDGDGLTNLVEYALGLDPTAATTTSAPQAGTSAGNWTYTYTRPSDRSDLAYAVEISTDLVNWTTSGVTHSLVSDVGGVATYQATYPTVSADKLFFRLKITVL